MFFRNLLMFRFSPSLDLAKLEAALEDFRVKPVGPLEMHARGFTSPFGRDEEALTHRVGSGIWLAIGGEDKLLPGAVVNDRTARKAAEAVLGELRQALGSFPALPLNAEVAPRSTLTGWVAGQTLPAGLVLGDECELRDPGDRGAIVRCQRQEMESDEVGKHLEAGKQCSKLALTLDDHLSFVVGDDLVVRKLKFLDGAVVPLENTERDSVRAELDARYALMVGEIRRLWAVLEAAFSLSAVD